MPHTRRRFLATLPALTQQSRNYRGTGIGGVERIGTVREVAFRLADERREPQVGGTPRRAVGLSKSNGALPAVRAASGSTGVGRAAGTQAQPEIGIQVHGGADAMVATMQVA